jgi:hypothetical protein
MSRSSVPAGRLCARAALNRSGGSDRIVARRDAVVAVLHEQRVPHYYQVRRSVSEFAEAASVHVDVGFVEALPYIQFT